MGGWKFQGGMEMEGLSAFVGLWVMVVGVDVWGNAFSALELVTGWLWTVVLGMNLVFAV